MLFVTLAAFSEGPRIWLIYDRVICSIFVPRIKLNENSGTTGIILYIYVYFCNRNIIDVKLIFNRNERDKERSYSILYFRRILSRK